MKTNVSIYVHTSVWAWVQYCDCSCASCILCLNDLANWTFSVFCRVFLFAYILLYEPEFSTLIARVPLVSYIFMILQTGLFPCFAGYSSNWENHVNLRQLRQKAKKIRLIGLFFVKRLAALVVRYVSYLVTRWSSQHSYSGHTSG
jgi:hypothetical protein